MSKNKKKSAKEATFGERYGRFLIKGLPADLASQHEHYRLGTPKRITKKAGA
jgi:hypothetical protein